MIELTFKKLSGKWYCDIPYEGDVNDLEMVLGADLMLEALPFTIHQDIRKVQIYYDEIPEKYDVLLINMFEYEELTEGATYKIKGFGYEGIGKLWICDVTLKVLGYFPERIYIKTIY